MFRLLLTLLISQCYCEVDTYFTVTMDQKLGHTQCQRKCAERRGCTAVAYSADSLTCTLRFNLSDISSIQGHPSCSRHYCIEVIVQTRSRKVHVLKVFDDTLWVFKPVRGETKCKITGRDGSVFEAYPHVDCREVFKPSRQTEPIRGFSV